ncbi:hypothetical protein JTB14_015280 [Gonioctena quinquepunctata]|nr:hypothetical protein JTB14_015280 [Gonioctena quinquepunctata]
MPLDEDTNDEAQLKRKLVEATESVRKKYKSIKSRHVEDKLELEKFHEPVMKPLQALSTLTKQNGTPTNAPGSEDNSVNTENNKINHVGAFPFGHSDSLLNTPSPSVASTNWEKSGSDDYSYIIRSYMKGLKNAGKEFDPQYGAALNSRIRTEDLQSYKNILIDSKAAYKDYNPEKGLENNSRRKFVEIIAPLLNEEKGNTSNIISTPKLNKNTKRSERGTGYMQELSTEKKAAVQEGIDNISRDFRRTFDDKIPEVRYTLSREYDILTERMTDSEQKVSDPRSKDRPVLAVPPSWEPTHEIEI